MPPQLVIANSPSKVYPPGVVVLRAADWLGPSRSTLSVESDPKSCCGTVVREAQKSSSTVLDHTDFSQWKSAPDTLVIPLGDIGLWDIFNWYYVLVSLLIEGSWDPDFPESGGGSTQIIFYHKACQFMFWGDYYRPVGTHLAPRALATLPRGLNNYRILGFSNNIGKPYNIPSSWEDYTLYIKGISAATSSIEFLIDQLYFLPSRFPAGSFPWGSQHFRMASAGDVGMGVYGGKPTDGPPNHLGWFGDGADGGDSLGKFTWHPYIDDYIEPTRFTSDDGGGDYQKADNEYYLRVVGYRTSGGSEFSDDHFLYSLAADGTSHCYSIGGAYYIPTQVWIDEDFARTIGDGDLTGPDGHFTANDPRAWGSTPEGFGWYVSGTTGPYNVSGCTSSLPRHGSAAWVQNGEAGMFTKFASPSEGYRPEIVADLRSSFDRAGIEDQNICITGFFRHELVETPTTSPDSYEGAASMVYISTGPQYFYSGEGHVHLVVNLQFKWWELRLYKYSEVIGNRHDISSWFSPGTTLGFRLELERFRLRVRVWDASDGEPSTWDFNDYRPLIRNINVYPYTERREYPYDDDLSFLEQAYFERQGIELAFSNGDHNFYNNYVVYWSGIKIYHDARGPNRSTYYSMERPEGNEVGRIQIPPGCQHLIYWGKRVWTELDNYDIPQLDFSMKAWNDPSSGLLQRAEVPWLWFASSAPSAPMNVASVHWKYNKKQPSRRKFRR